MKQRSFARGSHKDCANAVLQYMQIDKELKEDIYFFREEDGKWKLSLYKPLRWGIAGTAQIAEDVVSNLPLSLTPSAYGSRI